MLHALHLCKNGQGFNCPVATGILKSMSISTTVEMLISPPVKYQVSYVSSLGLGTEHSAFLFNLLEKEFDLYFSPKGEKPNKMLIKSSWMACGILAFIFAIQL